MSRTLSTFQLVLFPDNQGFSDECISLIKRNTAMEYPDSTYSMAVFVYSWPQMVATESLCLLEKLCLQERYCCWKDIADEKNKNIKNPLWLMQSVSYEPLMLRPVENPWASSDIFSQPHHHPFRFCINHKAINPKNTLPRFTKLILTLYFSSDEMFFRFIALKSMGALWKRVVAGFRFGH